MNPDPLPNPPPDSLGMVAVVCGVIEDAEGRYLACLRPQGKHLGGLWEFPGGKVDANESPEMALKRELHEELAVDVEVGTALKQVVFSYAADRMIRLLPFRCRIIKGEPHAIEHERLLWCLPENFHDLEWAAADIPILYEIRPPPAKTRN